MLIDQGAEEEEVKCIERKLPIEELRDLCF
jgi:hypothetical protein